MAPCHVGHEASEYHHERVNSMTSPRETCSGHQSTRLSATGSAPAEFFRQACSFLATTSTSVLASGLPYPNRRRSLDSQASVWPPCCFSPCHDAKVVAGRLNLSKRLTNETPQVEPAAELGSDQVIPHLAGPCYNRCCSSDVAGLPSVRRDQWHTRRFRSVS